WSVAERAKSFYLCQLVRNAEVRLFSGVHPALIDRLLEVERLRDALEREAKNDPMRKDGPRRSEAYVEWQSLIGAIIKSNRRWGAVREPEPFDVATAVQSLRSGGWTPVSYFFRESPDGGAAMHVFSTDAGGGPWHTVERWSSEEMEALRAACARLAGDVS